MSRESCPFTLPSSVTIHDYGMFVETEAFHYVRRQYADALKQADTANKCIVITIIGLAGVGKTALALALLQKHLSNSRFGFVIRSDRKEHLIGDLKTLATKLDLSFENKRYHIKLNMDGSLVAHCLSSAAASQSTLTCNKITGLEITVEEQCFMNEIFLTFRRNLPKYSQWMIILDNVELDSQNSLIPWFKDLFEILRNCLPGTIVVTSRHRYLLNYLKNSDTLMVLQADLEDPLLRLTFEQAKQIFFGQPSFSGILATYGSEQDLQDLITRLSYLPLAIKIAGMYVQEENISYADYRRMLKNETENFDQLQKAMLQDSFRFLDFSDSDNKDYIKTQRSAIQMSVKQIMRKTEQVEQRNLICALSFCAFLDPEYIPDYLLERFSKNLTKRKLVFIDLKQKMNRYSLMRYHKKSFSIHREVQWVLKYVCIQQYKAKMFDIGVLTTIGVKTFDHYLAQVSALMVHIVSFHGNCNKLSIDDNVRSALNCFSKKVDGQLALQIQQRKEAEAEQLQSSWRDKSVLLLQNKDCQNDEDVRSKAQLAALQAPENFQLPNRNDKFVGRKKQLFELENSYIKSAQNRHNMIVCIVGFGGMGKTALSLAYIYHSLDCRRYQYTIWLTAESPSQVFVQVQSLVKHWYQLEKEDLLSLNEINYIEMFYHYIQSETNGAATCIVLDNADSYSSVENYLPKNTSKGTKIDILVTSRNSEWAERFPSSTIYIEPLDVAEIHEYVHQEMPSRVLISADNTDMVKKLSDLLGGLSLALVQAVAYIKHNNIEIADYCELLSNEQMKFEKGEDRHMLTVQHTLTLAIHQVRQKNDAVDTVISVCSYLAPDFITKELLYSLIKKPPTIKSNHLLKPITYIWCQPDADDITDTTSDYLCDNESSDHTTIGDSDHIEADECAHAETSTGDKLVATADNMLPDLLVNWSKTAPYTDEKYTAINDTPLSKKNSNNPQLEGLSSFDETNELTDNYAGIETHDDILSQQSVDEALNLLHQYSIVFMEDSTIRIHRLTQAVMRDIHKKSSLYNESYSHIFNHLVTMLECNERCLEDVDRVTKLIPHGLNLTELDHQFLDALKFSQLWWNVGVHQLDAVGNPGLAIRCFKKTLKSEMLHYGKDNPNTAATLVNLGNAYGDLGHYERKRDLMTEALAINENWFGSDHPSATSMLVNLGVVYGSLGNYTKQRDLLLRALAIDEFHFGRDYPSNGFILMSLGNAYGKLGDYKLKRDLLIRALNITENHYGSDHPETARVLINLGDALGNLGDYGQQRELTSRALAVNEARFGPKHPEISVTLTNLANAYGNLGERDKQRDLLIRALAIDEAHFGAAHSETSITLTNLAVAYGELGDYEKQRDLLTRALAIKQAQYGPNHPETALTLSSLGNAFGDLGNYEKKRDLLTNALGLFESHYGPDHPVTAQTIMNLGNAYGDLGDHVKQRDLLIRSLSFKEAYFGPHHQQTALALTNLGNAYGDLGDYEKQHDFLIRALAINENTLGPDHPTTGITLTNLGDALRFLGDYQTAKKHLNRALQIDRTCYGDDHPSTAYEYHSLSCVFHSLNNFKSATKYAKKAYKIRSSYYGQEHSLTQESIDQLKKCQEVNQAPLDSLNKEAQEVEPSAKEGNFITLSDQICL